MLEASEFAATRGNATLFSELNFELKRGTLPRMTGADGSGKTSFLRALCGLPLPIVAGAALAMNSVSVVTNTLRLRKTGL